MISVDCITMLCNLDLMIPKKMMDQNIVLIDETLAILFIPHSNVAGIKKKDRRQAPLASGLLIVWKVDGQLRRQLYATFDFRRLVGASAVHSNFPVEVLFNLLNSTRSHSFTRLVPLWIPGWIFTGFFTGNVV
ncbi:MAG: hypothetical protein JXR73_03680 [Candidatus Omnitrophica bacterium]|nr:hypothetical protein [Candidatus Omnitrophota bacterium]